MHLRSACARDVDTLFDIRCSVTENHMSMEELAELDITPQSLTDMVGSEDYVTTLAEIDGRGVGFSMAQISANYVFACFVRPDAENAGVGRAVLTAAEQALRTKGVTQAWLSTGAEQGLRAPGFYRHLGWKEDGYLENGEIKFIKTLQRPE